MPLRIDTAGVKNASGTILVSHRDVEVRNDTDKTFLRAWAPVNG